MTKVSKWVCTRLAMTRYYEACGAGKFVKIEGEHNPADLLTKPQPVGAFKQHRAVALGNKPLFLCRAMSDSLAHFGEGGT